MILDDTPIQQKLKRMGNFLCGVERVKRFVKVHFTLNRLQPVKDKRNFDAAPLENFCGRP